MLIILKTYWNASEIVETKILKRNAKTRTVSSIYGLSLDSFLIIKYFIQEIKLDFLNSDKFYSETERLLMADLSKVDDMLASLDSMSDVTSVSKLHSK